MIHPDGSLTLADGRRLMREPWDEYRMLFLCPLRTSRMLSGSARIALVMRVRAAFLTRLRSGSVFAVTI